MCHKNGSEKAAGISVLSTPATLYSNTVPVQVITVGAGGRNRSNKPLHGDSLLR